MNTAVDSAKDLVDMVLRKAPEYVNLLTAETTAEFESAFDTLLEKAIVRIEENKKNFLQLDEEGLSAVLAAALSIPGLTVTQETHSNGHVDLTVKAESLLAVKKEALRGEDIRRPGVPHQRT